MGEVVAGKVAGEGGVWGGGVVVDYLVWLVRASDEG